MDSALTYGVVHMHHLDLIVDPDKSPSSESTNLCTC